jgi:uncharacterized small protein (DUF1192 family)
MKKLGCILAALLIVIIAGCEQTQQKQTISVSRKDRLIANENMNLKEEIARCQSEMEKQQNLVKECQEEQEKILQQTGENTQWLANELPQDLVKQVEELSQENEQLKAEIERLKNQQSPPLQPLAPSNNPLEANELPKIEG